ATRELDTLSLHDALPISQRIEALFEADPSRASTFSTSAEGLVFDWSKTLIDARARDLLLELATPVPARREAMFSGERINETEDRSEEHTSELQSRENLVC